MTQMKKAQKYLAYSLAMIVGSLFGFTGTKNVAKIDMDLSDLVKAQQAHADYVGPSSSSSGDVGDGDSSGEGDCSGCDGFGGNGDYP